MEAWRPASPFEESLQQVLSTDDTAGAVDLLRGAEFALPLTAAAFAGDEPPAWPTVEAEDRTWMVAYTSIESMRLGTDQAFEHARVASLPELAAGWPDHDWGLILNPGLPIQLVLEPAIVARVAAPSLLEDRETEPQARTPLMQKLLCPADIQELLTLGVTRVSGYCHQLMDVAHIATPVVLVEAVGITDEAALYITAEGAVNMLRWAAVGLELYHSPYGGVDEASCAAVDGWLIEEPPFVGLGFAPNPDQLVREYKIHGVGLPHGAEIWELTEEGVEYRRAVLDADLGQWLLVPAEMQSTVDSQDS